MVRMSARRAPAASASRSASWTAGRRPNRPPGAGAAAAERRKGRVRGAHRARPRDAESPQEGAARERLHAGTVRPDAAGEDGGRMLAIVGLDEAQVEAIRQG